jgi:L-malate glycosyltransferase
VRNGDRSVLMVLEATFPVRGGGGAESQVLTLGRCLLGRDVNVGVVVPMVSNGPQIARELVDDLDVTRIGYPKIRLLGGTIMLFKLAILLFARRKQYSFIHAHIANNMAAVCAVMGAILGKPVLIKLTGMKEMVGGILDANPNASASLKKWAMRRGAILQATSARIRQLLIDSGFDASRVIHMPNGVDVDRLVNTERDAGLRQELCGDARLVGVFVGRLAPEKGHETLLACWARAFASHSDVKLVLVGDGSRREALHKLAAELGIANQIVFAGHSDNVARYLAIADFALLTSLAEGLSNSLLEYMACGLPVVGSRVSGTEDFVTPGETGWLFAPGDESELERALEAVAATGLSQLRTMGLQAQQLIISTASLQAVTSALMDLYQFDQRPVSTPLAGNTAS